MQQLCRHLQRLPGIRTPEAIELQPVERSPRPFREGDEPALRSYVDEQAERFESLRYAA